MKGKKTVLIFGISSLVGSTLAEYLRFDYRVVGTYHKNYTQIPGIIALPCNVMNKDEVQLVMYTMKPDFVIYCAGLSSVFDCDAAPEVADAINTIGLFNVADYSQRYKSRVVFFSSSYVFLGEDKKYQENDIPDGLTTYGKNMAQAEFYVQKSNLNYLIFRTCPLYGRGVNPRQYTFFEMLQTKLARREDVLCDSLLQIGFLDVYYLAEILKICFEQGVSNRLLQVSSKDIMTHFDFAKTYCKVFGESEGLIARGKWPFPLKESPPDSINGGIFKFKMDITNVESYLNVELPTVEESLQLTYGRFNGEKDSKGKKKSSADISFI